MDVKIALFDPYGLKFTQDMKTWWEKQGHEVEYQRYYNPQVAERSDVIWFDTCDNNLTSATNPAQAILDDAANYQPWDLHEIDLSNKKVICRAIDIEVWQGHFAASHWDVVDDLIFIAPHIRKLVDPDALPHVDPQKLKIHTIPCGVDLDRWSFKEREPGFDIAVVSEKWSSKGSHEILQIALKLKQIDPRYKIHWLGQRSDSNWEYAYFDEFVEHHKLNIEFTNILNDGSTVDDFLEGKNYLLHGSIKEAFCYAIAEAATKGIKVVANRFFGADAIWGGSGFLWNTIDQAVEMIMEDKYDSASYRQYLIDKGYVLDSMMDQITKVIERK